MQVRTKMVLILSFAYFSSVVLSVYNSRRPLSGYYLGALLLKFALSFDLVFRFT